MTDILGTRGRYPSPLSDPYADQWTQPFWDAALEGRLEVPRCVKCGTYLLPPQPRCFHCQSASFEWVELAGTGSIYSFTVVRHALSSELSNVVPYVAAVIELDGTQGAGARMTVNVVNADPDAVRIGDKVQVVFDRVSETLAVPRAEVIAL